MNVTGIPSDVKYDMHCHAATYPIAVEAQTVLEKLGEAGIYGTSVFSVSPGKRPFRNLPSVMERAENLLQFCAQSENRLVPVLYLHPYEEDVIAQTEAALEKGIAAVKIICHDFFVSETKCMDLLSMVAKHNKPVIFHSGILWDGVVSSQYNRPVNWEALIEIPKLRFSMGHCSWPWIDECIALYGKILNSYAENPESSCEMFFDITPGTPEIYREELLTKLFTVGYDVPHNIMFGCDCSIEKYNSKWTKQWMQIDGKIMDKLGVPESMRKLIYRDNFLRFLGLLPKDFTHKSPSPDGTDRWSLETAK